MDDNYRSQIAQMMMQYAQQGYDPNAIMAGAGMGAKGNAQSPLLMGMMNRGPTQMGQGASALGPARR